MNEIVKVNSWQPIATVEQARERYQALADFVKAIMRPEVDFGIIPGTDRNTLLKPGAEKLASFFGLSTSFETVTATEDWTGADHAGESFFYYRVRCNLSRGGELVANAEGSANSWEKKYRYRNAERICPNCGNPAIIKGKAEYGGGWVCFTRKGGCNKKYGDNDPAIVGQSVGQVKNPDAADQVNTILKMAQKRALVAAVLIGVNGSDYFTQDVEDLDFGVVVDAPARPVSAEKPAPAKSNGKRAEEVARGFVQAAADNPEAFEAVLNTTAEGKALKEFGRKLAAEPASPLQWLIDSGDADNLPHAAKLANLLQFGKLPEREEQVTRLGFYREWRKVTDDTKVAAAHAIQGNLPDVDPETETT